MRPSPARASAATHDPSTREHDAHRPDEAREIVARAPTRIDFGGGWTDVPPYPERDGGFVCNLAIDRYARARLRASPGNAAGEPLARAALRRARVVGSAAVESDFPIGAGLGGSSAAGVALQAAIAVAAGEHPTSEQLAQRSRAVEVEELGVAGGWQDHYAAAYGGALALDLGSGIVADRIPLDAPTRVAIERRCLLLHTGATRISGANITSVLAAYTARDRGVLAALARMATLARTMAEVLRAGDLDALGALVREHWVEQRSLHPAITTERIDTIAARADAAGALGMKALGASGGGCVLIVTVDDPGAVHRAVHDLGVPLPFAVDDAGATVEEPG